ncbi:hypothetical protein COT12_01025 [Candidatus Berkelbacteria bacterium CG08_land_8_20_14_0_20_39_8]|uniref:Uncharacterized protein n=1 Tax=Candidatus Berkelbacteria bacterium CG08_land_8_20_14_0_20_39_8 TaxID=1974511 RepID=A0A2M6YCM7_9BACT|nr:MAG: hypothetical protein COT12_01025 [Candidatus Berkelbacteria bacterium CG08_land_8_20_14_0_20_39_8]
MARSRQISNFLFAEELSGGVNTKNICFEMIARNLQLPLESYFLLDSIIYKSLSAIQYWDQ